MTGVRKHLEIAFSTLAALDGLLKRAYTYVHTHCGPASRNLFELFGFVDWLLFFLVRALLVGGFYSIRRQSL